MTTDLLYRSFAKVNLYLDVLDRRPDGFHNIETIFQTVNLYDELHLAEEPHHISLTCSVHDLETGEGNLITRAAKRLKEECGVKQGARIHLDKNIPIAAGMAGGSGNAAATLVALNILWGLRLSQEEIREIAGTLGSDVPYCTIGGTAGATRRGEELFALKPLPKTWFVLIHPALAVSAARVYNHALLPRKEACITGKRSAAFDEALGKLERGELASLIYNAMEVPVFSDFPNLARARDRLLEAGCSAAAMSGSGPTLFGLCETKREADTIAASLEEFKTSVVHSVPLGVERVR